NLPFSVSPEVLKRFLRACLSFPDRAKARKFCFGQGGFHRRSPAGYGEENRLAQNEIGRLKPIEGILDML
ncbi:MAG TPA: hypothetical protein PK971_02480, partial [Saprospiraceae bacterium]|nr:hypothetical protein [Saprospiraceae bacterium]